ncbi:MAG: hypothetical protein M3R68_05180, partial [Acidobacteriota bacterium]|nr:hypothetical protein [Acidobacteriota bacterium]
LSAKFMVSAEIRRDVAPAVEITDISPSPYVRTLERMYAQFTVTLTNNLATPFSGVIVKQVSNNISPVRSQSQAIALKPHETLRVQILDINPVPARESIRTEMHSGSVLFSIEALAPGAASSSVDQRDSVKSVTRRTIPMNFVDVRVAHNLRVGYVPSFDGTIAKALGELGVEAKELSSGDIQNTDLKAYNAIIIDNRGYEAHPELIAANDRLLAYARDGGTLIVFYHKNNEWNPDPNRKRPQLAPYPITLGGERVTDENAAVSFLQPNHPLLNSPNKITSSDFAFWVQERGLYYPKVWDARYAALLAMNDSGEPSLPGGLLVGAYGRGQYIYTSLVWYRELRAGVPGAYRMLANMVSYGKR